MLICARNIVDAPLAVACFLERGSYFGKQHLFHALECLLANLSIPNRILQVLHVEAEHAVMHILAIMAEVTAGTVSRAVALKAARKLERVEAADDKRARKRARRAIAMLGIPRPGAKRAVLAERYVRDGIAVRGVYLYGHADVVRVRADFPLAAEKGDFANERALPRSSVEASLSLSFSCSPASGASSAPISLSFGASSENKSLEVNISPPDSADFAFFTSNMFRESHAE